MEIQVVTKQEKHLLIPQKMGWNGRRLEAGIAVQRLSPYFQFENLVAVAIKWNQRDVKEEALRLGICISTRTSKRERT